jgi:hypothetical protein
VAIEEKDQKSCEAENMLNSLRHEREKREHRLSDLTYEYEQMLQLENKSPEQQQVEKVRIVLQWKILAEAKII